MENNGAFSLFLNLVLLYIFLLLQILTNLEQSLVKCGLTPPIQMTKRSAWNNQQLHLNPNSGRAKDDYDLALEKWKNDRK